MCYEKLVLTGEALESSKNYESIGKIVLHSRILFMKIQPNPSVSLKILI